MAAKVKTTAKPEPKIPADALKRSLTKLGKTMQNVVEAEGKALAALGNAGEYLLGFCVDTTAIYAGDWTDDMLDAHVKLAHDALSRNKAWSKGTVEARVSEYKVVFAQHAEIAALAPRIRKVPHDRTFIVKLARQLRDGATAAVALKAASNANVANKPNKAAGNVPPRQRFYRNIAVMLRRAYATKALNAEDKARIVKAWKALELKGAVDAKPKSAKR